jgi:predicted AlkP superfamily pyrophosphatase or phosphodiesterase
MDQSCQSTRIHSFRVIIRHVLILFLLLSSFLSGCSQSLPEQTIIPTVNYKNTIPVQFLETSTATSNSFSKKETSIPSDIPFPTQEPLPTSESTEIPVLETKEPVKVPIIIISFDGAPAEQVYQWIDQGELPNFSLLFKNGVRSTGVRSIDPSLTAPAHASLATGCYPNKTGIVGNIYHNPNDSFYWYRNGFDQPLSEVEPIWVIASRAGLKTATLFFAGGTPFLPDQTADYTVAYGVRDAYSQLEKVNLEEVDEAWENQPESYSKSVEGSWIIPKVSKVYLLAVDTLDDQTVNYDTFYINSQRSLPDNPQLTHLGEWQALMLDPAKQAGAHFLIQSINKKPWQVTVFSSGVYHNAATPRSLLEDLTQQFGFFPASGDSYALEHHWINQTQYLEMLQRSADWMANVSNWVLTTYQPDILFTWQDAFDSGGHEFFPITKTNQDYEEFTEKGKQEAYLQSAKIGDSALAKILKNISLEQSLVFIVSDHGMAPVHTTINLSTFLEQEGLLVLDQKDYVVVQKSKVIPFASGGSVHFYINEQGVEKDGIVLEEDAASIREHLYELLSDLSNPTTGELIFSRIFQSEELPSIYLDNFQSGDLFAQANPGYNLDSRRGWKSIFEPTNFSGQHGYSNSLPEMQAIFIASGVGVLSRGNVISSINLVDIAPTIAAIFGLNDFNCDGKVISELFLAK